MTRATATRIIVVGTKNQAISLVRRLPVSGLVNLPIPVRNSKVWLT